MPKLVKLTGDIGGGVSFVDIYHTSVSPSNLISSSISSSVLINTGITFTVNDDVTTFLAYASGGFCDGSTGSVTASVYSPSTRHLKVYTSGSDEGGSVEMTYPFIRTSTTTQFSASVNFNTYPNATIVASSATYPDDQFVGWYYSPTSSTAFSTNSTLTLTLNTFTGSDNIYAYFSDI